MTNKYKDIINLPHHISTKHPPMSIINRAAQFSPFAALSGHDIAIKETARLTNKRIELDDYIKESLNTKLHLLDQDLSKDIEITLTYFQADTKKEGGTYLSLAGKVKKIDKYKSIIVMDDNTIIPINEIISIDI